MKSKIKKSSTGVKAALSPKAFGPGLTALRAAYATLLATVLEVMRPQIDAGEFLDLSDTMAEVKDIGAVPAFIPANRLFVMNGRIELPSGFDLLQDAIIEMPFIRSRDVQRSIFCCRTSSKNNQIMAGEAWTSDESEAACYLANDLRAIYRRQQRAARSH